MPLSIYQRMFNFSRYLLQQSCTGRSFLHPRELDAFLAQALSPHLTTECNSSNLGQIKLTRVDLRGVQLATIFMQGVEVAAFANDACGAPIPYELVCPWNYFDGKLFHSKLLKAMESVSLLELCDGKVSSRSPTGSTVFIKLQNPSHKLQNMFSENHIFW